MRPITAYAKTIINQKKLEERLAIRAMAAENYQLINTLKNETRLT